jgi:hypothetical protein
VDYPVPIFLQICNKLPVTVKKKNLVQEERYVLRNMERQEPQGEENHHNYHHHPGRVGKNPGFLKKTQPSGFFWVFLFFLFFFGFFVFFIYLPRRESF